jgi:hypothetical protein
MSLAFYAASVDNETNNDNDNLINKKKVTHNRTQKKLPKPDINSEKVNSVLESIHNRSFNDDDEELGDYFSSPPPKPESIGSQRASITKEAMQNINSLGAQPVSSYSNNNNLELNNFMMNYGDAKSAQEYYKKFIPNYSPSTQNYQQSYKNHSYTNVEESSNDVLIQKLNYMIHLLEEKQDEKTNNVTEEVVLYSFLGIFIIFIVDSFTRVGKYKR